MTCQTCKNHETAAAMKAANGKVYMADRVRIGDKQRLQRVVDHLLGQPHAAAVEEERMQRMWLESPDDHPWHNVTKKANTQIIGLLTHLAVDVYNDSLFETLAAWSWPARSLANMHAERVLSMEADNQPFSPLTPPAASMHYRSPDAYKEMLDIISAMERNRLGERLQKCLLYSIQVDGSLDRTQRDNKFVTARILNSEGALESVFLAVVEPDDAGAAGLLESVTAALARCRAPSEKLIGLTTDGESANTGRKAGLWAKLRQHLGRDVMTMWCVCHRSDLAMESVEDAVSEVRLWKAEMTGLLSYFRTSKRHSKALRDCGETMAFPSFFEVRFAEHLHQCCRAILTNIEACQKVWKMIVSSGGDRRDVARATGMLKKWQAGGQIFRLTTLMHDISGVMSRLQKTLQRSELILPDVMQARDSALMQLQLMADGPLPGGKEEQSAESAVADDCSETGTSGHRQVVNANVPSSRSYSAVRNDTVQSVVNFLGERLDIEQEELVAIMLRLVKADSARDFIRAGTELTRGLFGQAGVTDLVTSTCDQWSNMCSARKGAATVGGKLRQMFAVASGTCQKLLGGFIAVTPHSMGTERAVSHFNAIRSHHRLSMARDTVNARMLLALNGVGTASFDPRPAVAQFLNEKTRREKLPHLCVYTKRAFVAKFFRSSGNV